jgi:N-acetylmuramoyl-L-alanine amidase
MVKFMWDPGHDFNTLGKGVAGLKEFEFNRGVVEKAIALMNQYEDVENLVSHDLYDGIDTSLKARTDFANSTGVNCFVSVHANAASATSVSGIETFVHPRAPQGTVNMGAVVHGELIRLTGMNNRGLKRADFHVLRETRMDAVLVECGFMTNPGDLAKLKDEGYRQTCAQAIVNGLVQHYGLQKKVVVPPSPAPTPQPTAGSFLVKVIVADLWYYDRPDWNAKKAMVHAGDVFTVVETLIVNGSKMYKLKSGTYLTANPKYVQVM